MWVPLEIVEDFDLGFIPNTDFNNDSSIEAELFNGSRAATVPFAKDTMKHIMYKPNMSPGEIYVFRSTTMKNDPEKKRGVLYGSFRSNNTSNVIRRSAELRFMIFRKESEELNVNPNFFQDDNSKIYDVINLDVTSLSNNKARFLKLFDSPQGKLKRIEKTKDALDSLRNNWPREWQQPLLNTLNGMLVQGVREITSAQDKKTIASRENLPRVYESFQSNFYKVAKDKKTKLANLTIKDIKNVTNKFGVIEVFNGLVKDLNNFEDSYASRCYILSANKLLRKQF